MKKYSFCWLFAIIAVFIVGFSAVNFMLPDKTFSENENKNLAQFPLFSWQSLIAQKEEDKFSYKYETYINDQFWLRDNWIVAKSVTETALLKIENNGVVLGKDNYMFPKLTSVNGVQLQKNLNVIDLFAYNSVSDVSVMVVPTAAYPLSDHLPAGLPVVDQGFYIDEINRYLSASATTINVKDILLVNSNKYIYYRTDHHWTTYGAWLAYTQYASIHKLPVFEYTKRAPNKVENFLGTSYSKTKFFLAKPDTIEYFDVEATLTVVDNSGADIVYDSIYNRDQFAKRDKYAGFLYGNHPRYEIEGVKSTTKDASILVFCDSYGYSFVPFLLNDYQHVTVIDLRYYTPESVNEFTETFYDDVLFLYGFENLCNDTNLMKLES